MRISALVLLAQILLLSGCSSTFSPFPKTEEHIVGSGDTVYSIAFENDLDYRDLAKWNDIRPPYKIYTGQMLVLHGYHPLAKNGEYATASEEKAASSRSRKIQTRPIQQQGAGTVREVKSEPVKPVQKTPEKNDDETKTPVAVIPPPASEPVVAKAEPTKPVPEPKPKEEPIKWDIPKYDDPWIWPVRGAIIDKFSATNKGLDIAGKVGSPIRATAAGKVVYAGEGLKGYGLLLIVKHDQNYLSAYGHNDRLLVVQGESVKQGQPIATLGRGPENRAMLHFELRRNGKPVNPESLLPK